MAEPVNLNSSLTDRISDRDQGKSRDSHLRLQADKAVESDQDIQMIDSVADIGSRPSRKRGRPPKKGRRAFRHAKVNSGETADGTKKDHLEATNIDITKDNAEEPAQRKPESYDDILMEAEPTVASKHPPVQIERLPQSGPDTPSLPVEIASASASSENQGTSFRK